MAPHWYLNFALFFFLSSWFVCDHEGPYPGAPSYETTFSHISLFLDRFPQFSTIKKVWKNQSVIRGGQKKHVFDAFYDI